MMVVIFRRHELPVAYTMIAAAGRVKPRRDGRHPYDKFYYLWVAFNEIYTILAHRAGIKPQLVLNDDGSVVTFKSGSVKIPVIKTVSERKQIHLSLESFSEELKHRLIIHESALFFVNRTPYWNGNSIETDTFGQRVNGVINVNHTTNEDYPVWSPVDIPAFERYLAQPIDGEDRDLLSRQIVELLYTVRNNLLHGGKKFDDATDVSVIQHALPLLEMIVGAFTR